MPRNHYLGSAAETVGKVVLAGCAQTLGRSRGSRQ
jgi:hypothetical protein